MSVLEIILIILVVALAVALFMQVKAARKQAEDGQQLLSDYQRRVDEQQRLLEDYNSLSKNFENIGKGYEQALLLFDKMADIRHHLELIAKNDKDPDSVARLEDLLKKLPGVEVDESGNITANGETINKIMIDGKTFFMDDPQNVPESDRPFSL